MTKYQFSTFWNFLPLFHSCISLCIVNVESSTKMTSLMMIIALDSNPILGQALRMFNTVMVYVSTYNWISKKSMKKKSACPSISSGKDLSSWSLRLFFHGYSIMSKNDNDTLFYDESNFLCPAQGQDNFF